MRRASHTHLLLGLVIIAITIALGWLTQRLEWSIDVTENDRHGLSSSTRATLDATTVPVEIIAVLGSDRQQRDAVQTLVSRYQTHKPDIKLRFVNPETDPAEARTLNAGSSGELIIRGGDREQRLQNLSERSLTGAIRQITRAGERDIAFITGHEERSPVATTNVDYGVVSTRLASLGLVARELSLVSDPVIPDSVSVLVIAAPRRPYFPGELASIQHYLDQGGNLLWLIETPTSQTGQPASTVTTGPELDELADDFGIETLAGTVIDTASQSLNAESPDFVMLDRFPAHPVTRTMSSPVLLPQAHALKVTPLAGQTLLPLLQTPESSWTETGELSGAVRFDPGTSEVSGPLLLGVTIERLIGTRETGTQQRIAILGDADFAASQFVGNGGNEAFFESLLLWLAGDAEAMDFVTRSPADSQLELSNRAIVWLSGVLLAGIPLLLLLTAVVVRIRRHR